MKIEVSEWGKSQKILTIVAGFIYIIELMISFIFSISIANGGIGCISLSMFLLGIGVRQINLYKNNNEKSDLILGIIVAVISATFLSMGISALQGYFYTIIHR